MGSADFLVPNVGWLIHPAGVQRVAGGWAGRLVPPEPSTKSRIPFAPTSRVARNAAGEHSPVTSTPTSVGAGPGATRPEPLSPGQAELETDAPQSVRADEQ